MQISSQHLTTLHWGLPCLIHVLQHGMARWHDVTGFFLPHLKTNGRWVPKPWATWKGSKDLTYFSGCGVNLTPVFTVCETNLSIVSCQRSTCNEKPIGWLHFRFVLWYLKQETCWHCCNLASLWFASFTWEVWNKNLGHWISCRYILIDSSFSLKERDVPWSWCFHMNGYGSSWKIQWLQEDMWFLGKPMFSCYVTYVSFGVCGYGPMDYMDSGRCWWRDFSMGRMNSSIWIPIKKHPNYDTIYTKDSIYRACYVSLFCWFGFQNITFICLKFFFLMVIHQCSVMFKGQHLPWLWWLTSKAVFG